MLELTEVCKRFGPRVVADHLSLALAPGEILALLGPSGCGKSTLLSLIAGLAAPDAGSIRFAGEDLARVPPQARHFALMFQDYALFPHLDVLDNVCFGLVERRVRRRECVERARAALEVMGLSAYERRNVTTLSGGEAQRVALARALVTEPRLILLDEPFSSLDAHLRLSLQPEFKRRLKALGICALWVTHDRQEAFAMADRVALLHQGRIVQCAKPAELLSAPANAWGARFIGFENVREDAVVPDSAFSFGANQPDAMIEGLTVLADGVRLAVQAGDKRYVLNLSTREAEGLGGRLAVGERIGLGVNENALIRFAPA